jgi:hypothetical protein
MKIIHQQIRKPRRDGLIPGHIKPTKRESWWKIKPEQIDNE